MDFTEYALSHLPSPPARVLEVGCGSRGGVTPALLERGYDVLANDPQAPDGPSYVRATLEELDDPGPFAAVVAGRVLHHVHPLEPALDKLASLAPLLIVDEFAWNHLDDATRAWYEAERAVLQNGPDLDRWAEEHRNLHPCEPLRLALDARYEERHFEWRPYLYRWLGGAGTESRERGAIDAGAIRPLGFRYVGATRSR
ncbi:MAG: class I SAM-dependent methyltransferase [Actinomycetota bacterium]|nr:class I SAM-dependent methyltransferase [Actinomycetota bacterium]